MLDSFLLLFVYLFCLLCFHFWGKFSIELYDLMSPEKYKDDVDPKEVTGDHRKRDW